MADRETIEVIERNREKLERLAESDLPAAWIAQDLIEIADQADS